MAMEKIVAEPLMKRTIDGVERSFPVLGSMTRLDATTQLRNLRQQAFRVAISEFSQGWDSNAAANAVRESMKEYMASQLIQDSEVRAWLTFTPEGHFFLLSRSLAKGDPELKPKTVNEILDKMTEDQISEVARNIIVSIWQDDIYLHSLLYPEKFRDEAQAE